MTTQANHQGKLHKHSEDAKVCEFIPSMRLELTEIYNADTNVTREKEIISLSIGYSN